MTTKEFARQFGVSVSEMCEITGYTRQGLYLIINGKAGNSNKKKIAWNSLRTYAAHQFEIELKRTTLNFENRLKLVEIYFKENKDEW